MKCKKVQRLLPLLVGSDLSPAQKDQVMRHLHECKGCQHEYRMHLLSLKKTTGWLTRESVDWNESDWSKIIRGALRRTERKKVMVPWPFRKGWAFVLMATTAVLLSLFIFHPSLIKERMGKTTAALQEESFQDVFSIKIVSKETGLKINWFFHKDLKLEVME